MENKEVVMPTARSNGFLFPITKDEYLLIGGSDRNTAFNDTWILSIKEKKWYKIENQKIISDLFHPRSGFCGIVTERTENNLKFYLHGGQDYFTQQFFSDLIDINITINSEKYKNENFINSENTTISNLTKYPLDINKIPCERNSHCICYNEKEKLIYIFGGGTKEKLLNDLWTYNINENAYTKLNIENIDNVILPRELFGMIYNCKNDKNELIIFGGRLLDSIDNYSYIIDLNKMTCKKGNKMPAPLCSFSFTKINYKEKDYCLIYGGTDGNKFINNFIVYDVDNEKFHKSKLFINKDLVGNDPNFHVFLGRISAMMCNNLDGDKIILYGGSACDKEWSYINEINVTDIMEGIIE